MADEGGTGPQAHERSGGVVVVRDRPQLEERMNAWEGERRDKAVAGPQFELERQNGASAAHSSVMPCHRQDLPSVEDQISEAKRRKNETEEYYVQQVSASVRDKHSKAEERHRLHIIQERKNIEKDVAKEASRREAVLERKRRQEEETKQHRQAEFEKGERQRVEALERYSKLKKSPKSSVPNLAAVSSLASPTRPHRVSAPAYDPSSPPRRYNASSSHQPRLGQKAPSVFDRLYPKKSTGSLSTIVEEHAAPTTKSPQEAKVGAEAAAARGREKQKYSPKDIPSILLYPGQQSSNKQKKTDATSSLLKASAATEPAVAFPRPAKQVPPNSAKEKQETVPKATGKAASPPTGGERSRPHQYFYPSAPRVHLPGKSVKAGKEQKNGKKAQANSPRMSVGPKSSPSTVSPLATALRVPKQSADEQPPGIKLDSTLSPSTPSGSSSIAPPSPVKLLDTEVGALKAQQVSTMERTSTTEYTPRSSHDSGFGQRSSCEESRQSPTQGHPTCEVSSDYESDDGELQGEHSTKHSALPLQPSPLVTCVPEVPTVVIQPVESSHISGPVRGLTKTLSASRLVGDDVELTTPDTGPRRHSDTPRRKQGIAETTPPNIFLLDRHGSLPTSFPSNFQATFAFSSLPTALEAEEPSDSEDSHEESQTDSLHDGGGDLLSASKPTKPDNREARRSLVDQIMKETREEKKKLDLKPFLRDHKASVPNQMPRVPSSPVLRHPASLEDGSDREEVENDDVKEKKISAPALMMKRESVQFEKPIPYPHPVEILPSFPSDEEHESATDESDSSVKGIYLSTPQPAVSPPPSVQQPPSPGAQLTTAPESSSPGAFIDCVSSGDDDDDSSGSLVIDGLHGALMDVVISDDDDDADDEDQTVDAEFHKLLQLPQDDVIESDSEDESRSGGVLPCSVGVSLRQQSQWIDEVESSSDEAEDIATSESGRKLAPSSETEIMQDRIRTGSPNPLSDCPISHGDGSQSLTNEDHLVDEIDSSSSDSETEPLSVYGV